MATRKPDSTSSAPAPAPAPAPLPALVEGSLVVPRGSSFAIVASRFNEFVVQALIGGARDALVRHGAEPGRVTVVRVPGAWEIPTVCARLARSGRFDAIVAVGAVIRGGTPHFDHVAGEVSKGVAQVALETGVIVAFGVLTTDSIEQAVERAGTKAGNKGFDAAMTAIEMVSLSAELRRAGI